MDTCAHTYHAILPLVFVFLGERGLRDRKLALAGAMGSPLDNFSKVHICMNVTQSVALANIW